MSQACLSIYNPSAYGYSRLQNHSECVLAVYLAWRRRVGRRGDTGAACQKSTPLGIHRQYRNAIHSNQPSLAGKELEDRQNILSVSLLEACRQTQRHDPLAFPSPSHVHDKVENIVMRRGAVYDHVLNTCSGPGWAGHGRINFLKEEWPVFVSQRRTMAATTTSL